MSDRLSAVLPAWNEQAVIGQLVRSLDDELARRLDDYEIVVVDDASTDATGRVLAELERERAPVRVLTSDRNRGHGPSVLLGLASVDADWIFQLDSDGQFVLSDFWELWSRRNAADMILGVRQNRRDPGHRLVLSRAVSYVVSALARRRLRDPNVPFRLFRRAVWDDLRPALHADVLAPSILLALGAVLRGWRVLEVPVQHRPRPSGSSSLRAWRLVAFSARSLGELLRFRATVGGRRGGGAT